MISCGDVSEWLKERAWKARIRKAYPGFKSQRLRHLYFGF